MRSASSTSRWSSAIKTLATVYLSTAFRRGVNCITAYAKLLGCATECTPHGAVAMRYQLPVRTSDVVLWHATHGSTPGAGVVTGVCANCQIEKTTLRTKTV